MSRTTNSSPSRTNSACRRDTVTSSRKMSLSVLRPATVRTASSRKRAPALGPRCMMSSADVGGSARDGRLVVGGQARRDDDVGVLVDGAEVAEVAQVDRGLRAAAADPRSGVRGVRTGPSPTGAVVAHRLGDLWAVRHRSPPGRRGGAGEVRRRRGDHRLWGARRAVQPSPAVGGDGGREPGLGDGPGGRDLDLVLAAGRPGAAVGADRRHRAARDLQGRHERVPGRRSRPTGRAGRAGRRRPRRRRRCRRSRCSRRSRRSLSWTASAPALRSSSSTLKRVQRGHRVGRGRRSSAPCPGPLRRQPAGQDALDGRGLRSRPRAPPAAGPSR